jgi:alpha-tubulin suppressor-like RCC1 family protein
MGVEGNIGDTEHPAVLPGVDFQSALVQVSLSGANGCALEETGAVHCWGTTHSGMLGFAWDGENLGEHETLLAGPALDLGEGVVSIAQGSYFTCIAYADGGVRCWGQSDRGQTGYGTTDTIDPVADGIAPKQLPLVDVGAPVRSLSAGTRSICAVTQDGQAKCWGHDLYGTLGQGAAVGESWYLGDNDVPADYPSIKLPGAPIRTVSIATNVACALHEDGAITCWGQNSAGLGYGKAQDAIGVGYGDDESPNSLGHVDVGGPAKAVEVGTNFACALLEDGAVRCWGTSPLGQLGRGDYEVVGYPEPPSAYAPIDLGGPATAIAVGFDHSCAVLETGDVRCWGGGVVGALGYGSYDDVGDDETPASMPPVQIE